MSYEEKSTWIMGVLAIVTLTIYVSITLAQATSIPLTETPYVATMFWTIIGSIVASIVIHMALGMVSRGRKKDQRDRQFHAFGSRVGNGFLVAGTLAGLVMAWLEWDWFWIANVLYLGFVFSAILESIAKLVAYRRGLAGAAW